MGGGLDDGQPLVEAIYDRSTIWTLLKPTLAATGLFGRILAFLKIGGPLVEVGGPVVDGW